MNPPLILALLRAPSLWVMLGLGYAGCGAGLAWQLGRLGHGLGTSSMALLCWPLLLGLARRPPPREGLDLSPSPPVPPPATAAGPNGARIEACVSSLSRTMLDEDDPSAGALLEPAQLASLASSLHRADRRLARVDRLLGEAEREEREQPAPAAHAQALRTALGELRSARQAAQAELDAVLSGLLSLRVQLGMFALAGEVEPVRERLAELEARVSALAELSSLDLPRTRAVKP